MRAPGLEQMHLPRLTLSRSPPTHVFPVTQLANSLSLDIARPQYAKALNLKIKMGTRRKASEQERRRIAKVLGDYDKPRYADQESDEKEEVGYPDKENTECDDRHTKQVVGPKAVANYYRHYKKLSKVLEQNSLHATPSTMSLTQIRPTLRFCTSRSR